MADNFRLNIGSLRSDVKLTLHTHHAARIWMGRPKNDLKAGIIGLSGFCTVVNRMSRGAQQDDPYSDWWMILLEEKINDSKEALKTIEDRLDTAMASLPPAISISENLSIQPVSLPLYISNPLGFQAVYLLTNYDEIVRRILLAQHVGLVGRHDMEPGSTKAQRYCGDCLVWPRSISTQALPATTSLQTMPRLKQPAKCTSGTVSCHKTSWKAPAVRISRHRSSAVSSKPRRMISR